MEIEKSISPSKMNEYYLDKSKEDIDEQLF